MNAIIQAAQGWLVFLMLLAIAVLVFLGAHIATGRQERQWKKLEEEHRLLQSQYLVELDTALEEWLGSLGLPQLEDQTTREEAARRLSNVLLAKLMRWRVPGRPSMARQPD